MKKFLSLMIIIFLQMYCASVLPKKEIDTESPNIRIERYPETFNMKGKGPVLCGSSPCTGDQLSKMKPDEIKGLTKDGVWEEWVQKERTSSEKKEKYSVLDKKGLYKDGKKEGTWQYFYEDGILLKETEFKNDEKNGLEKKYTKTKEVIEESNYVNNLLEGPHYKKTREGRKEVEGQYSQDKKTGEWKEYYTDKAMNGLKTVSNYREDKKHGKEIRYYDDGKTLLAEGNYENNLESGPWKFYYDTGSIEYDGGFKPVEPPAPAKTAGKDEPAPADDTIKAKAKRFGLWKRYYKSGDVFFEGNMDGGPTGECKFYHKGGVLGAKGKLSNDLMMTEGEWFDEQGRPHVKGKFLISILNLDKKTDSFERKFRPSKPFIVYKEGKKYLEVKEVEEKGKTIAWLFGDNGNKIGEGPIEPNTQKKHGCWTVNGKKVFYLMDSEKGGVMAQMQKCE